MAYKELFFSLKNVLKTTGVDYLNQLKTIAMTKAIYANNYYREVSGIVILDKYQNRVVKLQDELLEAQKKRRDIGDELAALRKSSNLIQEELLKVNRQENFHTFVDLMKKETELLKRESEVSQNFHDQDKMERDIFTAFTNAIRDSQEKQQDRAEFLKYFGLILTIIGSGASYLFSSLKSAEVKNIIIKQGEMQFTQMKEIVAAQIQEELGYGNIGGFTVRSEEKKMIDETRVAVKELYSTIVNLSQAVDLISKNAQNNAGIKESDVSRRDQYLKNSQEHIDLVNDNTRKFLAIFVGVTVLLLLGKIIG